MQPELKIFLDLDNTLVSTCYYQKNKVPRNKIKIPLYNNWLGKEETYYTQLRPGAKEFIEYCRSKAQTFILTAAATDYAQEHNKVLGLGFVDDAIIGRDLYCYYKSGMLCDRVIPLRANIHPNSILVDNEDIDAHYGVENLRAKMAFLGIEKDRLVKSREYCGGKQPPDFSKELKQLNEILLKTDVFTEE